MPKHEHPSSTGLVTIEADTVEQAMERLAAELGSNAQIVDAQKVQRGGIGGFFAKERVALTARPRGDDGAGGADVADEPTFGDVLQGRVEAGSSTQGMASFLEAVGWHSGEDIHDTTAIDAADPAEPAPVTVGPLAHITTDEPADTATVVDAVTVGDAATVADASTLADPATETAPTAAETPEAPPPGETVILDDPTDFAPDIDLSEDSAGVDEAAGEPVWRLQLAGSEPAGAGPVRWGTTELVRHGVPGRVVNAVAGIDPADDLGWIHGVADSVAELCRPLPQVDTVIVGPHADRLAAMLEIPIVGIGETAPYEGSFASALTGHPDDRPWLEFVRGNRDLHLVVGEDDQWRDLLVTDPTVVSWVGERAVIDALYLAVTLGAQLGYGTADGFVSPLVRALPVDVALALRRLVGRH